MVLRLRLTKLSCKFLGFWIQGLSRSVFRAGGFRVAQRLQYSLIKEYTLNHIRDPTII